MNPASNRYSPVRTTTGGNVTVDLAGDHPGVTDPAYRARRDELAGLAARWSLGSPIPTPAYTDVEHSVWAAVSSALGPLHSRYACSAYLSGKDRLGLPDDSVPQLSLVGSLLTPLCGFRYLPVAGLAPLRDFYGSFSDGVFWSTQYLRHPSVPLYTPEPDVIHEVIGHANQLAAPGYSDMYRLVGAAVRRCHTDAALTFLSHVFWYTMEFGVVWESGALKAYGAGILSSVGETSDFSTTASVAPVDYWAMGSSSYDITHFQPVLYSFSSPAELEDSLSSFFSTFDDSTPASLRAAV